MSAYFPFPAVLDATMRRDFVSCPTKFWYSYIRQIASDGGPSIHLHAGAAFARGCEAVRLAYFDRGLGSDEAVGIGVEALIRAWGDFPDPSPDASGANKTRARMVEALVAYFDQYPPDKDELRPHRMASGKLAVEVSFALPLPGTKHPESGEEIIYCGRFDALAEKDGVLFVEDEKTTSQLGASWSRQWELRSQFTGYCWGARQFNKPVAGAVIRGISILKTQFGHAQAIAHRPDWMVDRWLRQIGKDIDRMVASWYSGDWDLNLDEACSAYSGCQFLRLCTSRDPEALIPIYYQHREWDPLHRSDDA